MIVASKRNLEVWVGVLYHLDGSLHCLHRAFVHGDGGAAEPSFLAQMTGEVAEKTAPIGSVGRVARLGTHKLYAVCSLVIIVETEVPGYHGVAGDERITHANLFRHKLHPFVEYCIAVRPRTVDVADARHHAVVRVESLTVPRLVHDGSRDGVLSGVSQHAHDGQHCVHVFATPWLHAIIASHGVRVLPKVDVEVPFRRFGKLTVRYFQLYLQLFVLHSLAAYAQCALVNARLGVARHTDVEPDGLCGSALYSQIFIRVEHVSHKRRVPISLVVATTAASFSVFIELVGHDVSHEIRLGIL